MTQKVPREICSACWRGGEAARQVPSLSKAQVQCWLSRQRQGGRPGQRRALSWASPHETLGGCWAWAEQECVSGNSLTAIRPVHTEPWHPAPTSYTDAYEARWKLDSQHKGRSGRVGRNAAVRKASWRGRQWSMEEGGPGNHLGSGTSTSTGAGEPLHFREGACGPAWATGWVVARRAVGQDRSHTGKRAEHGCPLSTWGAQRRPRVRARLGPPTPREGQGSTPGKGD